MSQGGHSEHLSLFALFYQSTPSCLKVIGWGGGPCDYCVSPSPFDLDFGTSDSGLTIWFCKIDLGFYDVDIQCINLKLIEVVNYLIIPPSF